MIPFQYNSNFFGGTEYAAKYFHKNILPNKEKFYNYQCIILPGLMPDSQSIINNPKEIILWLHNPFSQLQDELLFNILDPRFLKKLKYVIVLSNCHKEIIKKELGIPENKIIIISYGFDPITKNENKFNEVEKIKIIYTSSADRGLEILCESLKYIEEDFELKIFSNNIQIC